MNDVSWGTRQSGGGSGGDPRSFWDRLCCKPIPEDEPKEKISEKESEDAKKQFDRMQTVRKKQQSQKRWTQKTKRTKTHGITNLVKKAKLSLKQMNSNAGDKDTIEAISNNLSNKKYLKQSSNFEEFQYVPIDKNNFLTKVPSKASYENKVAVEQRIKEDVESDEYLSWAVVKQRPVLLRENTRCVSMSHYEYKFWLDMTDIKTGYIKKQGKDPDDAKAMQERSDKMTSEMKTFKNRMYHSFIYINLLWIVICSIVQIFGHKLKIYIFSEAFINSIYPEDVENEWHQQCRSNMLAGFPPFEFFFLFFYILLITIQFCCMIRHRFSTLTHWLAAINLKRSFEKAQKEVSRQASTK